MVTYESVCKKLGFDFMEYDPDTKGTEYDGKEPNPFDVLTDEELDFVIEFAKKS